MPRGFRLGWPHGPYWRRSGLGVNPMGRPYAHGRRNPFPFCRDFPWLPRWRLYSPYETKPNAGSYAPAIPYNQGSGYSFYQPGYVLSHGYPTSAPPTGVPTI